MQLSYAYPWLAQADRRKKVLINLTQPMTATQLSEATGIGLDSCSHVLQELQLYGLIECLTPNARRSRIYFLTKKGELCQDELCDKERVPRVERFFPDINWDEYSWVLFRHRIAILKTVTMPIRAARIARRAKFNDLKLRMSANNVRDSLRGFVNRGILRKTPVKANKYCEYDQTELAKTMRELIHRLGGRNVTLLEWKRQSG